MASVLTSFLVGIGFQADEASARQVGGTFDRLASKGKQLGAILAGAFSFKALTSGAADADDALSKMAKRLDVNANRLQAWIRVMQLSRGTAADVFAELKKMQTLRAEPLLGKGGLHEAVGAAPVDPHALKNAGSALEALIILTEQMRGMSPADRHNIAETFGLSDATVLASYGQVRTQLSDEIERRDFTPEMAANAAAFNDAMQHLNTAFINMADVITLKLLPPVTGFVTFLTKHLTSDASGPVGLQNLSAADLEVQKNINSKFQGGGLSTGGFGATGQGTTQDDIDARKARDKETAERNKQIVVKFQLGTETIKSYVIDWWGGMMNSSKDDVVVSEGG